MSARHWLTGGGLGLAALALSALAASAQVPANVQQACSADYKKVCAGTVPGGGRIMKCMQAHQDQLTDACRKALQDEAAKGAAK